MTPHEEAVFEKKADKHFKSHPELPNGRNFACWSLEKDNKATAKYKKNFDSIFPNSPGVGV